MKRRDFLAATTAAAITAAHRNTYASFLPAAPVKARLEIDASKKLATVPANFLGLSYESAQLSNPAFFAVSNRALIAIFRDLSTDGVLRLGGGTSEFTAFTRDDVKTPPPFDAVGPDTSKNEKSNTPITLESLRNLRAFLDATNWTCIYGLNLGRGLASTASDEADAVFDILGPRLVAFQIGNEPDGFRNRYRPAQYAYADYWKEWQIHHNAIVAKVPHAKFAGPDISNKLPYFTGFAEDAAKSEPDVILLTSHYYAMGPAGAPDVTLNKLLAPDPKLPAQLETLRTAAEKAHLPFRMSEGNSCWNGGQAGVSDTFASALWVARMMLQFAEAGCVGVNLHGGGQGFYTPIAGSVADGFKRRPEFYGMQLAGKLVGATLTQSTLRGAPENVSAFSATNGRHQLILLVNASALPVQIEIPFNAIGGTLLTAPGIDAKEHVVFRSSAENSHHIVHLHSFSAIVVTG